MQMPMNDTSDMKRVLRECGSVGYPGSLSELSLIVGALVMVVLMVSTALGDN